MFFNLITKRKRDFLHSFKLSLMGCLNFDWLIMNSVLQIQKLSFINSALVNQGLEDLFTQSKHIRMLIC